MNENLLRMYDWRMSLLDEAGRPQEMRVVPAVPLANQLDKGGFRFAPDIVVHVGRRAELKMPRMRVRYDFDFVSDYGGPVELVMEPGSILGDWSLTVNDSRAIGENDFETSSSHVRGSLGLDVTGLLRQGVNRIRVELTAERADGGLLNALYLAGGFGVTLDPPTLTEPVREGVFEDYLGNRLPYYAGAVEYETTFELEKRTETDTVFPTAKADDGSATEKMASVPVFFDGGRQFHECAEFSVNGGEFVVCPWSPRRALLPEGLLRPGANRLVTRVYTSLIRSFEGKWFDYERHAYRDASEE
jgi:hypothetical protein